MSDRKDVIVVGAGAAGLTAARALTTAGRDVVALEARERVGGRTYNVEISGSAGYGGGIAIAAAEASQCVLDTRSIRGRRIPVR